MICCIDKRVVSMNGKECDRILIYGCYVDIFIGVSYEFYYIFCKILYIFLWGCRVFFRSLVKNVFIFEEDG